MADQKPILPTPETPVAPKEKIEKSPAESESFASIEKTAEAESKKEEELIDQLADLRAKMAAQKAVASSQQADLDSDIEERKAKIVDSFVKAARAAGFEDGKVEHIMRIAERYLKKSYPDIADEIHDRIINERNGEKS